MFARGREVVTAGETAHHRGTDRHQQRNTHMGIEIRTAGIGNWPVVRAMGNDVTLNLFGRTNLLLDLLYREGLLPDVMACGKEGADALFINGESLGNTDLTVHFGIWRMVENYRTSGCLFDDNFAHAMRAVGVELEASEEQVIAEPA
jgi:hypothetical protein